MRKNPLASGEIYHIFTRSIANFNVFNNEAEFSRMMQLLGYYQFESNLRFSDFLELKVVENFGFDCALQTLSKDKTPLVQIIAYCLMPTHLHLIFKQLTDRGISTLMSNVLNSYTRYFNVKHKRKGPLWESEFKNVLIENDDQLMHLMRYMHLNPVTAYLVDKPEDWDFSSYKELLSRDSDNSAVCKFDGILDIMPDTYRKFVNDRISYQRELAKIKNLILD